jgi:formate hydrogenlyase subunit 6/NADH:ubiquinone oxidoreductase subunit I
MSTDRSFVVQPPALNGLINLLRSHDYSVVGPTVRDGVVVLDLIEKFDKALIGVESVSGPGQYRIEDQAGAIFGGPVGPVSPKRWMNPPKRIAWSARIDDGEVQVAPSEYPGPRAYLGIRPCDVAAMDIFGAVWPAHPDDLIIVAECTTAGETCFCTSMGTGPAAGDRADIVLTEIGDGRLLVRSRSDRGAVLLAKIDGVSATADDIETARARVEATADSMGRSIDPSAARAALAAMPDSAVWDSVAQRCLACANCTMVCPTCFCTSINDTSDLTGEIQRAIRWDSCFTPGFSEIHGGTHRASVAARYRHWATHKLSTWWEQFGTAGCVGCGRCITWCPVGIDITEEVNRIIKEVAHA